MIPIGAVSRQTGIGAATLRKWETRYGFPVPLRTAGQHRCFSPEDVDALIAVSRRMAAGQRAGAAIRAVQCGALPAVQVATAMPQVRHVGLSRALDLLAQNRLQPLEAYLAQCFASQGAAAFTGELALPLIKAVGDRWQQGSLPVYGEHLFSSILQRVVNGGAAPALAGRRSQRPVVLASPAGEAHNLALLLLNAVLRQAAIPTVFLQGGLPAAEIAAAAQAFKAKVVALSASVVYPPKLLAAQIAELRGLMDANTPLWIGGDGALKVSRHIEGVVFMTSIDVALQRLTPQFSSVSTHS